MPSASWPAPTLADTLPILDRLRVLWHYIFRFDSLLFHVIGKEGKGTLAIMPGIVAASDAVSYAYTWPHHKTTQGYMGYRPTLK